MPMKRSEAARRHRNLVAWIAALASLIVVVLHSVVPRVERAYQARDLDVPWPSALVFQAGHWVREHSILTLLALAVLITLLWSAFSLLDRRRGMATESED